MAYSKGNPSNPYDTTDELLGKDAGVEMDETYVGGKPRKQAKKDDDDFPQNKRGRGTKKQAVVGIIERKGNVKTHVAKDNNLKFGVLSGLVKNSC